MQYWSTLEMFHVEALYKSTLPLPYLTFMSNGNYYYLCQSKVKFLPSCLCLLKGSPILETSIGLSSRSRYSAVSRQVTEAINPAVGCHYFPPGPGYLPSCHNHCILAGTKLYCVVTEAHVHKQRAQGCPGFVGNLDHRVDAAIFKSNLPLQIRSFFRTFVRSFIHSLIHLTRLRQRTDRALFSRLVQNLARKRGGSVLQTQEPPVRGASSEGTTFQLPNKPTDTQTNVNE